MLTGSHATIVAQSACTDEQVRRAQQELGFYTSVFEEGAQFRIWGAFAITDCQVWRHGEGNVPYPGDNAVCNCVLMTKDVDAANPKEWRQETLPEFGAEPVWIPADLKEVTVVPLSTIVIPAKGFKLVSSVEWRKGDFQKGLCSPSAVPDAVEIERTCPRSLVELLDKPQFLAPRNWFMEDHLGLVLFKNNFKTLTTDALGGLKYELKAKRLSLLDYEAKLHELVQASETKAKVGRIEHPYLRVRVHYSEEQYRGVTRGTLWEPAHKRIFLMVK